MNEIGMQNWSKGKTMRNKISPSKIVWFITKLWELQVKFKVQIELKFV